MTIYSVFTNIWDILKFRASNCGLGRALLALRDAEHTVTVFVPARHVNLSGPLLLQPAGYTRVKSTTI
jgi:hypothetical protein